MKKAGYHGAITEALRKKIRVTRYQSTLYTMHYGEYVAYVKKNRGGAPAINGVPVVNGFKPGHWFILQKLEELFIIYLEAIWGENLFEEFQPLTAHCSSIISFQGKGVNIATFPGIMTSCDGWCLCILECFVWFNKGKLCGETNWFDMLIPINL